MIEKLVGSTIKFTWISSGAIPSDLFVDVYNGSETLVGSSSMVSSGNGHYYSHFTVPSTPGFYVAKSHASISGYPFIDHMYFRAVTKESD